MKDGSCKLGLAGRYRLIPLVAEFLAEDGGGRKCRFGCHAHRWWNASFVVSGG